MITSVALVTESSGYVWSRTLCTPPSFPPPPPPSPPPPSPPPPSPPPPSPCPTSPPPLPSPSRHTDKMPYQSHLQWHKNPHNTYFENFQNILKTNQPTDNTIYISDSPSLKNARINEEIQHKYFLNSGEEFLWVGLSVGLSVGWLVGLSVCGKNQKSQI